MLARFSQELVNVLNSADLSVQDRRLIEDLKRTVDEAIREISIVLLAHTDKVIAAHKNLHAALSATNEGLQSFHLKGVMKCVAKILRHVDKALTAQDFNEYKRLQEAFNKKWFITLLFAGVYKRDTLRMTVDAETIKAAATTQHDEIFDPTNLNYEKVSELKEQGNKLIDIKEQKERRLKKADQDVKKSFSSGSDLTTSVGKAPGKFGIFSDSEIPTRRIKIEEDYSGQEKIEEPSKKQKETDGEKIEPSKKQDDQKPENDNPNCLVM